MSDEASLRAARQRADEAKLRELATHRRAILVHEHAAVIFDGWGKADFASTARVRAVQAREMLRTALVEQAQSRTDRANSN